MEDQKDNKKKLKQIRKKKEKCEPLSDFIYKHSPIKKGAVIKDEDKPLTKVDKIMDRIYLGNYQAAKDRDFFKQKNIKAVLNCTKDIPNHFAHKKDIEYMRIPVDDSLKEKDFELMFKYMPIIAAYIDKHVSIQKNNIFVHCWAGRQRSVAAVVCYLISNHKMTPHEACKKVLERRPEAFHHGLSLNFEDSINKYYNHYHKSRKNK